MKYIEVGSRVEYKEKTREGEITKTGTVVRMKHLESIGYSTAHVYIKPDNEGRTVMRHVGGRYGAYVRVLKEL